MDLWSNQVWLKSDQRYSLKLLFFFSIFSSGSHFEQLSGTVWAILVEDLQGSILYWNKFGWNPLSGNGHVVWIFFLSLALVTILCSGAKRFEQFWLKSAKGLWRRCCFKVFISVALATILCTEVEWFVQFLYGTSLGTILSSFVEIYPVDMEEMSFGIFSTFFCSGLHFVQWEWNNLSNCGRGSPKEESKFCWNLPSSYGGDVVWSLFVFFYVWLWSPFCAGRGTVWAFFFVEELPKNYPIKFGWNPLSGYRGDVD